MCGKMGGDHAVGRVRTPDYAWALWLRRRERSVTCEELELKTGVPTHLRVSLPWNVKFSQELAADSPFRAREFITGKDALTLARDIRVLDQDAFSAAFRKSAMKRAKRAWLRRSSVVVLKEWRIALESQRVS